jgi:periplasmic copper chaperone A
MSPTRSSNGRTDDASGVLVLLRLRRLALIAVAATVSIVALGTGAASAHVSVRSSDAAAGGFGELTFRVPTESDTASTISLRVQLPSDTPLAFVSIKPVPGWTATTTTSELTPPVEAEGTTISEAITEITWTADPGAGIRPGEYQSFSFSGGPLPDADTLVLPAIQGYDDGTEVAWIEPVVDGQAEPEHPAPTLSLTAPDEVAPVAAPTAAAADVGDGLAVTALVVGTAGLLAGIAGAGLALATRRRSAAAVPPAVERERETVAV